MINQNRGPGVTLKYSVPVEGGIKLSILEKNRYSHASVRLSMGFAARNSNLCSNPELHC